MSTDATKEEIVRFVRDLYGNPDFVPLHEPRFRGNERPYVLDCIDSTFVSSVGKYVDRFEENIARYTGAKRAVAVVNGTQALQVALLLAGVKPGEEVITQSLTFVATANAVSYCGASPVFVDVDSDSMGMSPVALERFLKEKAVRSADGAVINKATARRIAAVLPMHTFGHPCRIEAIASLCSEYGIALVEDAAESLGSTSNGRHTGTFGMLGVFSFNGNKIITTGGGGAIVTDDDALAARAKHLTTTAKVPHNWEFVHDEIGYNFRMPNINAAIGVAQLEKMDELLQGQRSLAEQYKNFFKGKSVRFKEEPANTRSNCWMNVLEFPDVESRNDFLNFSNARGMMTRALWRPMHRLTMYQHCQAEDLAVTDSLYNRCVNISSTVR